MCVDEPALVSELDGMSKAGRERRERLGKTIVVPHERRRQLPEQRPELGPRPRAGRCARGGAAGEHRSRAAASHGSSNGSPSRRRRSPQASAQPSVRPLRDQAAGRRSSSPRPCRSARRSRRATGVPGNRADKKRHFASGRSSSRNSRRAADAPSGRRCTAKGPWHARRSFDVDAADTRRVAQRDLLEFGVGRAHAFSTIVAFNPSSRASSAVCTTHASVAAPIRRIREASSDSRRMSSDVWSNAE